MPTNDPTTPPPRRGDDDDLDALLAVPSVSRRGRRSDVYAGDVDIDGMVGWWFRLTIGGWVKVAAAATLLAAVAGLALVLVLPAPSLPSIDLPEVTWPW